MTHPDPAAGVGAPSFLRWSCRGRSFDLVRHGLVMGVVNVTPDSFSDGGNFLSVGAAVVHGKKLAAEGAALLDIGGESTRPGAAPVPADEQIRRVVPVLERLRVETDATLSIDTTRADVAAAALAAGAGVVNDISGLRDDPAMARVVRESGAGLVLMHMQGEPRTMQVAPCYDDVVDTVRRFFAERLTAALAAGLAAEQIVFDPGIGFGKTPGHNLTLLRHLGSLAPVGRPLLLGVSRKSFLGKILGEDSMDSRAWPTVALTSLGREKGARLFRVHDVLPNVHALRMTEAILAHAPAA